jgi:hypothetical protein
MHAATNDSNSVSLFHAEALDERESKPTEEGLRNMELE